MVDVAKRSQFNLYDPIDNTKHFKITQGETDCKMVVPNVYDLNCPSLKLTSGEQVVNNVASQILTNASDISTEIGRAEDAEGVLQSNINNEASARTTADSTLQNNINIEKGRITQEITDRTNAVASEQSRAEDAEGILQSNIDSEASARATADTTEQTARIASDNTLQTNIDTANANRVADVADLQSQLNTEKGRIDFIVSNTDATALDSLTEIVSAYQSADNSLINQVATLQSQLTALQAVVDALVENP